MASDREDALINLVPDTRTDTFLQKLFAQSPGAEYLIPVQGPRAGKDIVVKQTGIVMAASDFYTLSSERRQAIVGQLNGKRLRGFYDTPQSDGTREMSPGDIQNRQSPWLLYTRRSAADMPEPISQGLRQEGTFDIRSFKSAVISLVFTAMDVPACAAAIIPWVWDVTNSKWSSLMSGFGYEFGYTAVFQHLEHVAVETNYQALYVQLLNVIGNPTLIAINVQGQQAGQ